MYLILLLVGAFGFVAMTLLGLGHGMGGHHGSGIGHPRVGLPGSHGGGHGALHHGASPAGSALQGHSGAHSGVVAKTSGAHTAAHSGGDPWQLLMAVSPIDVFSVIFGAGAAGTLLKTVFVGWQLGLCAVAGGAFFALGVIRPLMGFLMRFASRPSDGLEGEVSSLGEATTRFDSKGQGVIRIILDEQVVQLLATLDEDERRKGVKVAKGEQVVIVSVDATRNSCVVSRELAPQDFEEPLSGTFPGAGKGKL